MRRLRPIAMVLSWPRAIIAQQVDWPIPSKRAASRTLCSSGGGLSLAGWLKTQPGIGQFHGWPPQHHPRENRASEGRLRHVTLFIKLGFQRPKTAFNQFMKRDIELLLKFGPERVSRGTDSSTQSQSLFAGHWHLQIWCHHRCMDAISYDRAKKCAI
jgi:hypothetical protein